MNMKKSLIFLILVGLPLLVLPAVKTDGADFSQQREGALLNARETPPAAVGVQEETNQPRLTPRILKSKSADAGLEAGAQQEKRDRYKPYIAGEGEKKIK